MPRRPAGLCINSLSRTPPGVVEMKDVSTALWGLCVNVVVCRQPEPLFRTSRALPIDSRSLVIYSEYNLRLCRDLHVI
eukprot:15866567-Heterocapsa_arctica.AAC.1